MEHKCSGCKHLAIDDNGGREAVGVYCCATEEYPDAVMNPNKPGKCNKKELDEAKKLGAAMAIGAASAGIASGISEKRHICAGETRFGAITKPALGLEPPEFIYEDRIRDILAAITRKLDQENTLSSLDYKHMAAWATELKGILTLMQSVTMERLG